MAKRKVFHVSTDIFGKGLSATAIAVFAYLSFCSDQSGLCFPSIRTISTKCSISGNTVRKALRELEAAGIVEASASYTESKNGNRRQSANHYRLNVPHTPANIEVGAVQPLQGAGSEFEGEINDKDKYISSDLSVSHNGADELIDGLELYLYEDEHFKTAVELTIRDMWQSDGITVNGMCIPQARVRERLRRLNIDCIDRIYKRMGDYGQELTNAGKYLVSCLYNAPVDFNTDMAAFKAAL